MKKFIIKSILFGMAVLLFCLGIECFLLTVSNEYSYKRRYVEQQGDAIKVLILGHSHAGNGINPEYMGDSVFNMAISGRNHYYDAILAERYIPQLKNLKCVIWPLGYNFQYSSYQYPCVKRKNEEVGGYNDTYKCMYEKYMNIPASTSIPYYYWSEILHSGMGYGSRAFKKDFEEQNMCTPLGFNRSKVENKSPGWKTGKLPFIVDYKSKNAPLALEEGLSDFKRIARVCHDNGVRLVVVTFPCYKTFHAAMTERGIKEMQDCVDAMRSVHPSMEYYNYIKDSRFTDDDFQDSSHLTEVGAKKFTQILWEEYLKDSI